MLGISARKMMILAQYQVETNGLRERERERERETEGETNEETIWGSPTLIIIRKQSFEVDNNH